MYQSENQRILSKQCNKILILKTVLKDPLYTLINSISPQRDSRKTEDSFGY